MTALAPRVVEYLESFGRTAPATYEELDPTTALAVSVKADYEVAYGEEDGWDEVPNPVAHVIPRWVADLAVEYCARTRASAGDLLEEGERWLTTSSRR